MARDVADSSRKRDRMALNRLMKEYSNIDAMKREVQYDFLRTVYDAQIADLKKKISERATMLYGPVFRST